MVFCNQDKLQIVIETKGLRDLIDYQSAMIKLIHDMAHYSHDQGTHEDFPIHLSHACTLLESMLLDYDALATISNTIQEKPARDSSSQPGKTASHPQSTTQWKTI